MHIPNLFQPMRQFLTTRNTLSKCMAYYPSQCKYYELNWLKQDFEYTTWLRAEGEPATCK